jgi:hypothetical protein
LDRRLGGPQSRSGRGGEEKNSQPPPGIELLGEAAFHALCPGYLGLLPEFRILKSFVGFSAYYK